MSSYTTPFVAMPETLRKQWLAWAKSHDWGHDAKFTDDGKMCGLVDNFNMGDGWITGEAEPFSTPRALRNWAGY